jgi:hypothetical protein
MNDTHLLLILLYAAFYVSLGTWIMRSFVAQLPIELEEAAAVDGAGLMAILGRVVLPLVVPGIITVAIFVVVFAWNEYVFAMIFTTRNAKTAPVVIGEMLGTVEGCPVGRHLCRRDGSAGAGRDAGHRLAAVSGGGIDGGSGEAVAALGVAAIAADTVFRA